MQMQSLNKSRRSFEIHESLMAGELSPSHSSSSVAAFDREAPLDGRPFIEDDHRTESSSSSSSEE